MISRKLKHVLPHRFFSFLTHMANVLFPHMFLMEIPLPHLLMKPLHSNSMALEIAFSGKKCSTNTSFLHEPVKRNSACVLLTKGFFCNKHTKSMGIIFSSTDFKVSHLAPFPKVWIDVLFHCFVCIELVCQVCLTFHSVVVKEL